MDKQPLDIKVSAWIAGWFVSCCPLPSVLLGSLSSSLVLPGYEFLQPCKETARQFSYADQRSWTSSLVLRLRAYSSLLNNLAERGYSPLFSRDLCYNRCECDTPEDMQWKSDDWQGLGQRFIRPCSLSGAVLNRRLTILLHRLQFSLGVFKPPSKVRKPVISVLAGLRRWAPCTAEPSACDSEGHSHHGVLSCGEASVSTGGCEVPHVSWAPTGGMRPLTERQLPLPVSGTCSSPRC